MTGHAVNCNKKKLLPMKNFALREIGAKTCTTGLVCASAAVGPAAIQPAAASPMIAPRKILDMAFLPIAFVCRNLP